MKKILIDTNAYTNFLKGDNKILEILSCADTVYITVIVIGELYAGFKGGSKEQENIRDLETFLKKPTIEIINITKESSEIFGEIKNDLKKIGKPIPINDIWIGANTIETGSVLITYDSHFNNIEKLRSHIIK